jgi:hypothetical protein
MILFIHSKVQDFHVLTKYKDLSRTEGYTYRILAASGVGIEKYVLKPNLRFQRI